MDDDTLYLTITRGSEPRPIIATSDPGVIRAVAEALAATLRGAGRRQARRVLRLAPRDARTTAERQPNGAASHSRRAARSGLMQQKPVLGPFGEEIVT